MRLLRSLSIKHHHQLHGLQEIRRGGDKLRVAATVRQSEHRIKSYRDQKPPMNSGELTQNQFLNQFSVNSLA
ncbi:hypothetical protein PIB30_082663, partial [Stylosanthes scabra]|nr:hypothetical protein [Stylosanthes scabra]